MLITETQRSGTSSLPDSPRVREVVEQHGAFVCRSLRHLGVREVDLDDTMQDVFLVVHRRLDDYEERGRTRAWLYSICRRVVVSQRRKLSRWQDKKSAPPPEPTVAPTQFEHVENREALVLGYRLLDELTPQEREIFLLYEVEDRPMVEIANALGCRLQTAYSRLYKARTRIQSALTSMCVAACVMCVSGCSENASTPGAVVTAGAAAAGSGVAAGTGAGGAGAPAVTTPNTPPVAGAVATPAAGSSSPAGRGAAGASGASAGASAAGSGGGAGASGAGGTAAPATMAGAGGSGGGAGAPAATGECDRACLLQVMQQYLDAVIAHDPTKLKISSKLKMTDNGVVAKPGDGIWKTATALVSGARLDVADPVLKNVATQCLINEGSTPVMYEVRLKIEAGEITEIESITVRRADAANGFFDPANIKPQPVFAQMPDPAKRMTREQLSALQDQYLDYLEGKRSGSEVAFDANCARYENGVSTASGLASFQFQSWGFEVTRRVLVIDEEAQITYGMFPFQQTETALVVGEAFKMLDNKIVMIQAIMAYMPSKAWD